MPCILPKNEEKDKLKKENVESNIFSTIFQEKENSKIET